MLTVCSLGCSERVFKSHWLPLHLTLLVQPALKTNPSQQHQHKWSHCCTLSKYVWLSQSFHAITPCWFSTQKALQLVLFKFNSGGRISLTSRLHNMCIYIYSNIRLQIVPFFLFELPLVCGHSRLKSGGWIKRQSVFERTGQWCVIRAVNLITSQVGAAPKQQKKK